MTTLRSLSMALLVLAAAIPVAHAASSAQAALTNLSFTAIDLNPADGIAPSYSFLTGSESDFAGGLITGGSTAGAAPFDDVLRWQTTLLLSPGSRLDFSADGAAGVSRTDAADFATAIIRFHFNLADAAGAPPAGFLAYALNGVTEPLNAKSGTRAFTASVFNTSDQATTVVFRGLVGSWGQAAPVPEPETYAMLLLGLGVLGGVARRRVRSN